MIDNKARFEDILFDNQNEVVETSHKVGLAHYTSLTVNGELKAVRCITADGTTYVFARFMLFALKRNMTPTWC